jgi:hypothetical protein
VGVSLNINVVLVPRIKEKNRIFGIKYYLRSFS